MTVKTAKSQRIRKRQKRYQTDRHRKGLTVLKRKMALRRLKATKKVVVVSNRTIWPTSQLTLTRASCVPRFSKSESIDGKLWQALQMSTTSVFSCSTADP